MNHLTEEELVFHYYGEDVDSLDAGRHLDECDDCRALYGSLQRVLNTLYSMPGPQRDDAYGARVWQRIEAQLPRRRWNLAQAARTPALRWAFSVAAMAALLVA